MSNRVDRGVAGVIVEDPASGRSRLPMESLLDGLRKLPPNPNEVVMLPGREADRAAAAGLAERVRVEVGLPVTAIYPSSG